MNEADESARRDAMVLEMARAVDAGAVCVQGLMTPLAAVALAVAQVWHPDVRLLLTDGCVMVDSPPPIRVTGGSDGANGTCRTFTFAELICEMVPTWQPLEFMRPAQIDRLGRSNNVVIRRPNGDLVLPGPGGIPEATNVNRNLCYYLPRHDTRTFVSEVDFVSGAAITLDGDPLPCVVFTELCTMRGTAHGLELTGLLPGVTVDTVRSRTGFELLVADELGSVPSPTEEDSALLQRLDPGRIRDLEFLGGAARASALRRALVP